MSAAVLPSIFTLTLLMSVGLLFFIRASVKDRIETIRLASEQPQVELLDQLQAYFKQRAYRIASSNAAELQVTFEGFVRPSLLMAIFLTLLAAIGLLCVALMMSILFPGFSDPLLGLTLIAPIAGAFYWRGAARPEKVVLQVEEDSNTLDQTTVSVITMTAHRDELAELQRKLPLKML